eukprot:2029708-Prymnesium_polylepis.1
MGLQVMFNLVLRWGLGVWGRAPAGSGAEPRRGPGQGPGGVRGRAPRKQMEPPPPHFHQFLGHE